MQKKGSKIDERDSRYSSSSQAVSFLKKIEKRQRTTTYGRRNPTTDTAENAIGKEISDGNGKLSCYQTVNDKKGYRAKLKIVRRVFEPKQHQQLLNNSISLESFNLKKKKEFQGA